MAENFSRRKFFRTSAAGSAFVLFGIPETQANNFHWQNNSKSPFRQQNGVSPEFPKQDYESVRDVVGASHTRFDRVKELVTKRPELAKASWDWGFGDWESALGAASHMGREDIAELLMEHGARPNIFTFAMLGKLEAVKGMVEAVPGIQQTHGPHDITLLQHARNRLRRDNISGTDRQNVEQVVAYLESIGDADINATRLEISDEEKQLYLGQYNFGSNKDEIFTVALNSRGSLSIRRGEQVSRFLNRVESHAFAPSGAPSVRIRFDIVDGQAVSLTVHDPVPIVKAVRVGS